MVALHWRQCIHSPSGPPPLGRFGVVMFALELSGAIRPPRGDAPQDTKRLSQPAQAGPSRPFYCLPLPLAFSQLLSTFELTADTPRWAAHRADFSDFPLDNASPATDNVKHDEH